MNIRNVAIVTSALAIIAVAAVGCSSSTNDTAGSAAASGNCPAAGSKACEKDDAITQADVDQCNKAKSDAKCGSAYVDILKCAGSNVTCGADGKADSSKITTACKTQTDAYVKCVSGAAAGDGG